MSLRYAFNTFSNEALAEFAKVRQEQARHHAREQAQHQREADAARKELKRRKRGN